MCLQTHGIVMYINNAQKQLQKKSYLRELKQISKLPPGWVYKWNSIKYIKSHIPNMWVNFLFVWKGHLFLCKEFINWRILSWIWKIGLSGLSTSLDLHIPLNLELILGNWYLARYKKMKHLESNCILNF